VVGTGAEVQDVVFVGGATRFSHMPEGNVPEVAFVGRSNVGKSSLLNCFLARRSMARVSGSPGKTREINFYLVNGAFHVVDLPGYGYAKFSRAQRDAWRQTIGRYVTERAALRLVFQLIDARHAPTGLDRDMLLLMKESSAAHVVVLTKADKLSGNGRQQALHRTTRYMHDLGLELPVVLTSSEDGRGRTGLWEWVDVHVGPHIL